MTNIKILQTPEFLKTSIPEECIPKRFAVATNILLCAVMDHAEKGFLLFNYEPEKWNQWYPYFSSISGKYIFNGSTYGDLVDAFEKDIVRRSDVQARIGKAEKNFLELLGVTNGNFSIELSPIPSEMWLKYSKTQDVWTFYYMEFLMVKQLPKINFDALNSNVIDFLPMTDEIIQEVLQTGRYRGINIVDNTLDIIKDKTLLNKLLRNAITL